MRLCFSPTKTGLQRKYLDGFLRTSVSLSVILSVFVLSGGGVLGYNMTADDDEVYCVPEQVHLSYGDVTADIVVLWSTRENCSTSLVYGPSPWGARNTATGRSVKFAKQNENGTKYLHRVELKNLFPSTTYFYRPLSSSISVGPFYFKTQPLNTDWSPMFLVYGDLDFHDKVIPELTTEVLKGQYSAFLHAGGMTSDMAGEGGKVGDRLMQELEIISSHVPHLTAVGSSEIDNDTFAHYRNRFSMPGSDWPIPLDKMWYSINIGPVHLISYSTEVFFTLNEKYVKTQRDWLVGDLVKANQNRKKFPWIIVLGHRAMYCSTTANIDCTKADSKVRMGFEDIFYHYGVDIVLQAHGHSYERLWPQYRGVMLSQGYNNPAAPIQLITGPSGSEHDMETVDNTTQAPWSAFQMENGTGASYGKLHVINKTHLYWQQLSVVNNKVVDSMLVVQEKHGPFKTDDLPENISHVIKENIKATGSKPDFTANNPSETSKSEVFQGDKTQRVALAVSFGALGAVLILIIVLVKVCKRKRRTVRRWEQLDFNYGKKFYSSAKDIDQIEDLDNDFEIDMTEGTPTTKLLTDD